MSESRRRSPNVVSLGDRFFAAGRPFEVVEMLPHGVRAQALDFPDSGPHWVFSYVGLHRAPTGRAAAA